MSDWWHISGWPTADEWQAIWTFVGVLVAGGAAFVALRQLGAHHKSQLEQSRPYVIVDFVFRSQLLMIEVKNIGQSPAEDIKLDWSIEPKTTEAKRSDVLKRNLVDGTIPFLAPGRSIKYAVDPAAKFFNAADLPRRFEVVAAYRDPLGNKFSGERSVLDLGQWAESLAETDHVKKAADQIEKQVKATNDLVTQVKRIADTGQTEEAEGFFVGGGDQ